MSFRTAARISLRSLRATTIAQPARRAASTGGSAKKSSDAPWAMGSAVVFGGLTAYILMPGTKAPHDAHAAHEVIGHDHASGEDKGEHEGPAEVPGSSSESSEEPSAEEKKSTEQALKSDTPKTSHTSAAPSSSGPKEIAPEKTYGGKSDDKKEEKSSSTPAPAPAAETFEAEEGEGRKAEDIPSEEMQKKSIERGEKTDAPKVAMDEEAKGHQTQASLDK